jgi:hypothetical protein
MGNGLANRLRKLQEEAEGYLMAIPQADGTVERFHADAVMEALLSHYYRGRAHLEGTSYEALAPAHPLVEALRGAEDLDALAKTHGTIVAFLVAEEEVLRGERERPGPPVTWNAAGTVCR